MKSILPFIILIALFSCKKESDVKSPIVPEVEYRIVNNGDANVSGFVLWTVTTPVNSQGSFIHDVAFNNVKPFDTLTVKMENNPGSVEFLNATQSFQFRVGFKQKVFSPVFFDAHYIQDGNPYEYGWTYTRNYVQLSIDSVSSPDKRIYYLHWPADSARLKEVLYF